ncbi:hypothetical protein FVE85_8195 [Porphyridium purpureum]|uniref:Complex 1 LYR protein n=1 Tax=Porphyridium purpureum TaxID=35688 RepID=A0A5J4YN53_PORPP|nr:hypothetical protein FVE85_8195 [Porphyridium purpureum]|eukprot:POR5025..scf295_9
MLGSRLGTQPGPTLRDFLLDAQVRKLYRAFLRLARLAPRDMRGDVLSEIQREFRSASVRLSASASAPIVASEAGKDRAVLEQQAVERRLEARRYALSVGYQRLAQLQNLVHLSSPRK